MYIHNSVLALAALVSTVHSHAAILAAVGDKGKSQGFLVNPDVARNCTNISPCQQDATIIRDAEITQNIVNACGRTELNGNIDIGEQTETELAAGRMTTVTKGSSIKVTIHQVNADGAGPFECDLDDTSNSKATLVPLKVTSNVPGSLGLSAAKEQDFEINVEMPADLNCIGASTGNICTVRCRNNAVAGPFGGCFAVQQTDGGGRKDASASGVKTAQTLAGIEAQVLQNVKDFPAAVAANQAAGAAGQDGGAAAISALVTASVNPQATQTAAAGNGNANAGKGKGNAGKGAAAGNAGNAANAGKGAAAGNAANAGKGAAAGNAAAGNAANAGKGAAAGNAAAGNAAAGNAAAGNAANAGKGAAAGNAAAGNAANAGKGAAAGNAAAGNAAAGNAAAGNAANAGKGAAAGNAANAATGNAAAGNAAAGNAAAGNAATGNARGKGNNNNRRRARRSKTLADAPLYLF